MILDKRLMYISIIVIVFSCTKEEKFVEPDFILKKWSDSIKQLDYNKYKDCEAYPKGKKVFNEMYKTNYFVDLMVTDIEDLDKDNVNKDHKGNSYLTRKVSFECAEVKRISRKPAGLLRGDVDFVRFLNGSRKKEGWLMWNRSIIRIKRN